METYTVKVYENGYRVWYQNGKLHRVDGPAVEWANGDRSWYQNDQRHRVDGPAIEYVNGYRQWWIEGKQLTQEEFNKQTKKSTCENKTVIIDGVKYKLVKEKIMSKQIVLNIVGRLVYFLLGASIVFLLFSLGVFNA
jgi:hypothetical protein